MFSDDLNEIFELEAKAKEKRSDLINRVNKKLDGFKSNFGITMKLKSTSLKMIEVNL